MRDQTPGPAGSGTDRTNCVGRVDTVAMAPAGSAAALVCASPMLANLLGRFIALGASLSWNQISIDLLARSFPLVDCPLLFWDQRKLLRTKGDNLLRR